MSFNSDNDHRRKKHKHDKYESNKIHILMDLLLGGSVRKRRRSSSTSCTENSRSKHHHVNENRRGEEKHGKSYRRRASKHRRNSRKMRIHSADAAEAFDHDKKTAQAAEPKRQPDISEKSLYQKEISPKIVSDEILSNKSQELSPIDLTDQTKSQPIPGESAIEIKKPDENLTKSSEKPEIETIQEIYTNLLKSWQDIVQQGLSAEANAILLEKYQLFNDSQRFRAPNLNPALKSLLNGAEIVSDDKKIAKQNQFGSIICSIQRGIFSIINSDKKSSSLARTVESMNDCASFIAQLHYSESIERRERIIDDLGIQKIEIGGGVGQNLFSRDEEMAILERRELEIINVEVEKRLAIAEKKIEENEPPPEKANTGEEEKAKEDEEEDTPCSQRFGAIKGTQNLVSQPKVEGARGVKNEKLLKAERGAKSAFDSSSNYPGIDELMRISKLRQGVPAFSIPFMKNTLAPSTWKSYDKQLEPWWNFCHRESVDVYNPTVADVLSFVTENHNNGTKTSALKTARSALSQLLGKDLGKNEFLSMLMKGLEAAEKDAQK